MKEKDENQIELLVDETERLFICEGKVRRALQKINHVLRSDPENPRALVLKGQILFDLDRVAEALQCYERTIAISPKCSEAFLECARIRYAVKEENTSALQAVEKALLYSRRDRSIRTQALCLKGNILSALDRDREALGWYRKALKLNPKDYHAYEALGDTFLGLEKPNKALPYLEKAWELLNADKNQEKVDLELTISSLVETLNALGHHQRAMDLLESNISRVSPWGRQYLKPILKNTKQSLQKRA